MSTRSKKERLIEYVASEWADNLEQGNPSFDYLDRFVVRVVRPDILNIPKYSVDHIKSGLVEFGYMSGDYTLNPDYISLLKKHEAEEEKLAVAVESSTANALTCRYCEYTSSPMAVLEHYRNTHSYLNTFLMLKRRFGITKIIKPKVPEDTEEPFYY